MKQLYAFACLLMAVFNTGAQSWQVKGNSGLSLHNYIGTNDKTPFLIKVNKSPSGYIGFNDGNSAWGYKALEAALDGQYNTGVGTGALQNVKTASFNTALGAGALNNNLFGNANVGIGVGALLNSEHGNNLVAIGDSALMHQQTNNDGMYANIAVGSKALFSNTSGSRNTANGYQALYSNTTGHLNTATGAYSLKASMGAKNTANGAYSLLNNIEGYSNSAIGYNVMYANRSGYNNTAMGTEAMYNNIEGVLNTSIGFSAGYRNKANNKCTFLGSYADHAEENAVNSMALGYEARTTASNQVRIGNAGITSIGGQVGWSTLSDGRFKKDIAMNVPGLTFINKLQPVTYHLKTDELKRLLHEANHDDNLKNNFLYSGFIAQQVEKAAADINYDFSGVDKPKNENDLYSLRYAEFVVPLVKAVQELSVMNDEKEEAIKTLQQQNNEMETRLQKLEELMRLNNTGSFHEGLKGANNYGTLYQNTPNPFSSKTTISYKLPETFKRAQMVITNNHGTVVKQITLSGTGEGKIEIDADFFKNGLYNYALFVDDRLLDSKKMILSK